MQNAKCKMQSTIAKFNQHLQSAKFKIRSAISNCKIQYDEGSFPADYLEDLVTSMEGTNGFGFKHSWGNLRRIYFVNWSCRFWRWRVVMMKIKTMVKMMITMMMLMYWWCYDDDDNDNGESPSSSSSSPSVMLYWFNVDDDFTLSSPLSSLPVASLVQSRDPKSVAPKIFS